MNKLEISIKTESYLLSSSGEGDALIDADVVFHQTGFPYIPGRRVKGLLKESMEEVLEILNQHDKKDDIIEKIFGKSGEEDMVGIIVPNLYLPDWENVNNGASSFANSANDDYKHAFNPDFIRKYYTTEIQQTAIEDDIAKDRSLRNYRVLLPEITFMGLLSYNADLSEEEIALIQKLIQKAALNLRSAGTRRNRGFGKIKCEIGKLSNDADKVDTVNNDNSLSISASNPFNKTEITVKMTTLSPVVLALQLGDQNTVFTEKYVNGNRLRGFLAGAFMQMNSLQRTDAHKKDEFREIFLSEKVRFGNLKYNGVEAIPLHIHKYKGYHTSVKPPVNVFAERNEEDKKLVTKPVGDYGILSESGKITNAEPSTSFFFHNTREVRSAGRSTKDQTGGGIFYYEALDEGQSFYGTITSGHPEILGKLNEILQNGFEYNLGKSRSAQYGRVKIEVTNNQSTEVSDIVTNGDYLLILKSPLILLNDFGEYAVNEKTLTKYIFKALSVEEKNVLITGSAATYTTVEQFNSVWRSKSEKITAYKEGSVFRVSIENMPGEKKISFLGEWHYQGFGRIRWEVYDDNKKFSIGKPNDTPDSNINMEPADNQELRKILNQYNKEKELTSVKTRAIRDTEWIQTANISGHLISRMEYMIKSAKSENEIETWLTNIKKKPAEESLKSAGLLDDDKKFNFNKYSGDLIKNKIYWLTFFQTLRKKKKTHGK